MKKLLDMAGEGTSPLHSHGIGGVPALRYSMSFSTSFQKNLTSNHKSGIINNSFI
jgi:hypothetical protein